MDRVRRERLLNPHSPLINEDFHVALGHHFHFAIFLGECLKNRSESMVTRPTREKIVILEQFNIDMPINSQCIYFASTLQVQPHERSGVGTSRWSLSGTLLE